MDDVKRIQELIEMHCSFRMDGCDCVDMKEKCSACLARHLVGHGVTVQKKGKWVEDKDLCTITCPECGNLWCIMDNDTETFDYCPRCGAKLA